MGTSLAKIFGIHNEQTGEPLKVWVKSNFDECSLSLKINWKSIHLI